MSANDPKRTLGIFQKSINFDPEIAAPDATAMPMLSVKVMAFAGPTHFSVLATEL